MARQPLTALRLDPLLKSTLEDYASGRGLSLSELLRTAAVTQMLDDGFTLPSELDLSRPAHVGVAQVIARHQQKGAAAA